MPAFSFTTRDHATNVAPFLSIMSRVEDLSRLNKKDAVGWATSLLLCISFFHVLQQRCSLWGEILNLLLNRNPSEWVHSEHSLFKEKVCIPYIPT